MRSPSSVGAWRSLGLALCVLPYFATGHVAAQSALSTLRPVPQANRIAEHPDFAPQTRLSGHLPPWVSAGAQVASRPVDLTAPLHLSIVLRRDPAVQTAFTQFLADQQDPSSPLYHQWLTPQQVGALFGPTAADIAAVSSWLTAQGLTVDSVAPSGVILEITGPTAAAGNAFRTSFAYFDLNGTPRLSAIAEPSIPTALAPVIDSIHGLTEVPIVPLSLRGAPRTSGAGSGAPSGTGLSPLDTNGSGSSTSYYLTPNDFATIYDINSVYTGGDKGATIGSKAQHIAIIGRSRVAATDISEYAANVGIASYKLNTVIPTTGSDPGAVCTFANAKTCGTSGDQGEQTLDVDRVIGTAPGVQADLVVSKSSNSTDGVYIAAAYNVNTQLDPIMTISYGSCEYGGGSAGDNIWDALFSTGAAEGISTFVSSGDSGANACAGDGAATTTVHPASINSICASSYATCVGGTEFNDTASPSTYWSASNGTGLESALSYIPEGAWNDPAGSGAYEIAASGGGPSLYIAKPTWQTGTGVLADGHRDTPDVAYPASPREGFYICLDFALGDYTSQGITSADNCTAAGHSYFFPVGGTSAAAPSMAGVTALLNTRVGLAQGNLNPLLYKLAASTSGASVFHDATVATSGVTNCLVTVPSLCNNSTPSSLGNLTTLTGGEQGYLLTAGYDEATGLGSIDVANLLTATAPALGLSAPAALSFTSGAISGNSTTTTLSSVNSFAGTVSLTCAISSGAEVFPPICSVAPASATLTANGSSAETITIGSTTAQLTLGAPKQAGLSGRELAALLAALLLCLALPGRRALRPLAAFALLALGLCALSGCGSSSGVGSVSSSSGGSGGTVHGSSAGSYTVMVTATGTSNGSASATTATTTFALTIH